MTLAEYRKSLQQPLRQATLCFLVKGGFLVLFTCFAFSNKYQLNSKEVKKNRRQ